MKFGVESKSSYALYGRRGMGHRRARAARRQSIRRFVVAMVTVVVMVGAGLFYLYSAPSAPAAAATATAPSASVKPLERTALLAPLKLPADDSPHGARMEWWYYNGILKAETGERFAFHAALFVANGLIKQTVMHAALTELRTGQRHTSQSRTGGEPTRRDGDGFDFNDGGWQVAVAGPEHQLRAPLDGATLALELDDARAPVAHRAAGSQTPGLIDFGDSGVSYYYSRPRMAAHGQVVIGERAVPVTGEVWFDHQWGDFEVLSVGWNWFALHLDDGSDVMLYQLFDGQGHKGVTAGTVSDAHGSTPIDPAQVTIKPAGSWTSPSSGVPYVVEWDIALPSGVLHVRPLAIASEFDSSATTANIYWEGPVQVSGHAQGEGFLELNGYDRLDTAQKAAQPGKAR
jgi:predicted secreted hydrolase